MTHLASFDGTRLAVKTAGPADAPTVVLVHGLGLSTRSWGRVPELLVAQHRVVTYDLRGHGDSAPAADRNYTLDAHARDLAHVLGAQLRDGERAVVVGHSLGGGIILVHAKNASDHLMRGVVFAGSGGSAITLPGPPPPRGLRWAREPLRRVWLAILRATARLANRARRAESVADWMVRKGSFEPDPPPDAVAEVPREFMSSRPEALAATTLASGSHNGMDFALQLDVLTLVLHGDHDPQVPSDEVRRLVGTLPRAELVQIAGAGHMLPLTRTEEVAAQIGRWVREVHERW